MVESINLNNTQQVPQTSPTQNDKKEGIQDSKYTNTQKVIMGTVAAAGLTAATIGGILYTKGRNLSKEIDSLACQIKHVYQGLSYDKKYSEIFDIEKVNQHIDDALRLPKKKDKLAKLKELSNIGDRGLSINLTNDRIDVKNLPENIQEAIKNKDHITASKLYCEYCDTLFEKSKVTGKTIEETIQNVFGKNTIVKPHSYQNDVNEIVMTNYTSGSGYFVTFVDKNNMVANKLNHKVLEDIPTNGCIAEGFVNIKNGIPEIRSGIENGRTYVTISYGDSGNGTNFAFTLFGKKGVSEFTQAQQDLKNLDISKLTKEEIELLSKLPRNYDNSNYDAVLSLVQTLSENVKYVF